MLSCSVTCDPQRRTCFPVVSVTLFRTRTAAGGRPWLGTYHLVAVYGRSLKTQEVLQNFRAGAGATASGKVAEPAPTKLFDTQFAPIMVKHCLECHDSATRKGGLDLSRKLAAMKGGESGKAIIPGKVEDSPLWKAIVSGDMPKDRKPLSSEEKAAVKRWITGGAHWAVDQIDPATYANSPNKGRSFVRRLTVEEYIATVKATVGVDISKEAKQLLPPDLRADGFSNTAYNLTVDLKHIDAYSKLARTIVSRVDMGSFARRFSRSRKLIDKNMRALISKMGTWVLRGPMDEQELNAFRGVSTSVAATGAEFEEVLEYTLEAMLQSPRFIYRIENQRGDGLSLPVSEYELASRLSYAIWGASPDRSLYDAAASGHLSDDATLQQQARRMLQDPRAIARSQSFVSEWLHLDRLKNLRPGKKRFPKWDAALADDMRRETLAFFKEVAWTQKRPLTDLFNAQVTFLTPRLAAHYGLPARGKGLTRYDLQGIPSRGGLLTQGSTLTVGGDEASMVSRGLFVLHDVLRGIVRDPPPCVDTTPVPTSKGRTQRGIAEVRMKTTACSGCHGRFEPLAFGLEKFDGIGRFSQMDEHGNRLREDGRILIPGAMKAVPYSTSQELMNILAKSERVPCSPDSSAF